MASSASRRSQPASAAFLVVGMPTLAPMRTVARGDLERFADRLDNPFRHVDRGRRVAVMDDDGELVYGYRRYASRTMKLFGSIETGFSV